MATKDQAAPAEESMPGSTDQTASGPQVRMVDREAESSNNTSPYGSYKQRPFAVAALSLSPHPVRPEAVVSWEPPHEGTPDYYRLEFAGVSMDLPGEANEVYLTNLEPGSQIRVELTAFFGEDSGMLYLPEHPIASGDGSDLDEEA